MTPTLSGGAQPPPYVYLKASALLAQFALGQRVFKRIKPNGYLKIDITHRWRLLSKNGGQHWHLMTHERYNTEYRK